MKFRTLDDLDVKAKRVLVRADLNVPMADGKVTDVTAVDVVLTVDKLSGEIGASVTLPAVLVVDDGKVISDPAELGRYQVTAEIVGDAAGPKIHMIHYKNKTGYRRRLGHRQKYTQVRVTGIGAAKAPSSATIAATVSISIAVKPSS